MALYSLFISSKKLQRRCKDDMMVRGGYVPRKGEAVSKEKQVQHETGINSESTVLMHSYKNNAVIWPAVAKCCMSTKPNIHMKQHKDLLYNCCSNSSDCCSCEFSVICWSEHDTVMDNGCLYGRDIVLECSIALWLVIANHSFQVYNRKNWVLWGLENITINKQKCCVLSAKNNNIALYVHHQSDPWIDVCYGIHGSAVMRPVFQDNKISLPSPPKEYVAFSLNYDRMEHHHALAAMCANG
jgi:hypothetical protein